MVEIIVFSVKYIIFLFSMVIRCSDNGEGETRVRLGSAAVSGRRLAVSPLRFGSIKVDDDGAVNLCPNVSAVV